MQQLVVRAVEEFLRQTYGDDLWLRVAGNPGDDDRLALMGGAFTSRGVSVRDLVTSAAAELGKTAQELLEDGGAWLASREAIRRLLRFSGHDFRDFILSLEELPGRAHFVVPDLGVPEINVSVCEQGVFWLTLPEDSLGWPSILGGIIRAMADDYGALGVVNVEGNVVTVGIPDDDFSAGREFSLVRDVAPGTVEAL
ncbi:heme NO-binding domain-containing protein [Paracoccus seriniphilus]|uniref:heme NO-binding domain-containing protein n=1 Tax=Paracoccus seriniphilus TaxID=184748 RepID=UPI00356A182B